MKSVVDKPYTDASSWGDIHRHFDESPNDTQEKKDKNATERKTIVDAIRGQVHAGENRIAAQPLERYSE